VSVDIDALDRITDAVLAYRPKRGKKAVSSNPAKPLAFYEFFAGGGMVRAGLGPRWECLFANDFDIKKGVIYRRNWAGNALVTKDVAKVSPAEIPGRASLAWASFPCQDLSLAGMGAGLRGGRSGTFWPFWRIIEALAKEGRSPRLIALENVCGMLTSHGGKDFAAIADAHASLGCRFGAVVIDAAEFVPQSRPRLFIIAVADDTPIPEPLISPVPTFRHTSALRAAHASLSDACKAKWVWWNIPPASPRTVRFADLVEESPDSVKWHTAEETKRVLEMMSPVNLAKVEKARATGELHVGAIYKRTRFDGSGNKVQRAEVRFDDLSGCLRTSTGGSSRQVILIVQGETVRSRLISSRETARLMGLPDSYELPSRYNEAYHLTGDGVVVPVVRHLADTVFEPVLASQAARRAALLWRRRPGTESCSIRCRVQRERSYANDEHRTQRGRPDGFATYSYPPEIRESSI
jgi:DNA (cytosine-5)-methyltransferase 1